MSDARFTLIVHGIGALVTMMLGLAMCWAELIPGELMYKLLVFVYGIFIGGASIAQFAFGFLATSQAKLLHAKSLSKEAA